MISLIILDGIGRSSTYNHFSVDITGGPGRSRWAFRAISLQGSLSGPGGRFAIPPSDGRKKAALERCTGVEWCYMETHMGTCIYISK